MLVSKAAIESTSFNNIGSEQMIWHSWNTFICFCPQIVVLDPNLSTVDEQYVRILQRYKELLRNADSIETEVRHLSRHQTKHYVLDGKPELA